MLEHSRYFLQSLLMAVGALLPIVDPLSSAPVYLQMTADVEAQSRSALARLVAIDCFLLLLASTLLGKYVLDFFGLSLADVQVGGGIVVCAIAWSLLNKPDAPDTPRTTAPSGADWRPKAFFPLTLPLTVGPGSISVAIALGAHHATSLRPPLLTGFADLTGILLVAVSIYLCYKYAQPILRKLGRTGTTVLSRLSAFLLLCIGVQIASNGLHSMLATLLAKTS